MSARSLEPEIGEGVAEILSGERTPEGDSVTLIVGLREELDDGQSLLNDLLERSGGEISANLGFEIYEVSLPIEHVADIAHADELEFVEYSDPEGSPTLMGN